MIFIWRGAGLLSLIGVLIGLFFAWVFFDPGVDVYLPGIDHLWVFLFIVIVLWQ
jgi:hypothetical protein